MKIRVKVPASSANLGPGFDVFGLAIDLYNEFIVEEANMFEIKTNGANSLPKTKDNLFYQSFAYLFQRLDRKIPKVKITMNIQIPLGRGFGSSATAVVGGLMAANIYLKNKYAKDDLLPFAVGLERGRHPDNVTPALMGGLIIVTANNGKVTYVKLPFPKNLKAIYFVPEFAMDTAATRKLMPKIYPKEDVVFNTSRVALLLAALQTGKHHLLRIAMEDKIHQPTRTKIFPLMPQIIDTALTAGAYGAALSGGGSSIIAIADKDFDQIAKKMSNRAKLKGLAGKTYILEVNNKGTEVFSE
ncbi:homoserine kinase [Candidatus Gottesmanbacteria bacterium]|nr:homoserine kinase [Candidatus Gottesmanbacteria bacterium]